MSKREELLYEMRELIGRAQAVLSCTARATWANPQSVSVLELGRVIDVACDEIEKAQQKMREYEMMVQKGEM